jgi:hypothetical protein
MMHTYNTNHFTFHHDSDLSGVIIIVNTSGEEFEIIGSELLEFISLYVMKKKITKLVNMTNEELLGIDK